MIAVLFAAALAAQAPAAPLPAPATCVEGRGVESATCRATQAANGGRFAEAAGAFEEAATLSMAVSATVGDARADKLLAAAGNMWIAANEPGKAALALDRALAGSGLAPLQRGEALLDRARAAEAQDDLKTARAKVSEAEASIAADPFLWYFSAALAIRENNPAAAKIAIGRALALAPSDPTILFEAGHVAHAAGDEAQARHYWSQADRFDTNGAIGKAAREALLLLAPQPADGAAGPPQKPADAQPKPAQ
ncbi:hypothetical protein [Sphingomonas sp.]|uniref:tetratricopeptide repeat protein n=1 Tax=Sphingomonas sp. TaxID=28214 RepID=UPI00286E0B86|nr:hypothetical protein [Sphingomonas sp.]